VARGLTIARLELRPFRLRLRQPLRTAGATYQERWGVEVRVVDDAGQVGRGEATPLPAFGTETLEACQRALEEAGSALGGAKAPANVEEVTALLSAWGGGTRACAARHGVELGLLDLLAQTRGVPVARLLCEAPRPWVRVNALLTGASPRALADEARAAAEAGFRVVKMKVGASASRDELERVRAVRGAVGEGVEIRLDANGAWTKEGALAALSALGELRPELCEQPVPAADVEALRDLRWRVPVRLAADEAVADPAAHPLLLGEGAEEPAVDALVLKPMVLGGLLPALALAHRAHARDVDAYVTSALDGPVARLGALHLAASLPSHTYASGLAIGALLDPGGASEPEALRVEGGKLKLPGSPGLGMEPLP
jgi:o-succinylbenzoate synthase